jgi:hypothetical protein
MRLSAILDAVIPALLFSGLSMAEPAARAVPAPASPAAVNQLLVSGNACGPAALLNAFRFGDDGWRKAGNAVKGADDRERILTVINGVGMRPSNHLPGRARWSRSGVGVADLRDMANEMTTGMFLPPLGDEVFFLNARETPGKLLARVRGRLSKSVRKGFPPLVSLRRYALRTRKSEPPQWIVIDAHFVTLTQIQEDPAKGSRGFGVSYIDPWGGRHAEGVIRIPDPPHMANASGQACCLEAVFPKTTVGSRLIRNHEKSFIAVSAFIGRW